MEEQKSPVVQVPQGIPQGVQVPQGIPQGVQVDEDETVISIKKNSKTTKVEVANSLASTLGSIFNMGGKKNES